MSQAEALLNSLVPDETVSYSVDPASEPHIVINRDKTVTIPEELKRILVQYEHNIETVTFDCPRYWDGHDLSDMAMRIVFERSDGHKEPHPVENLRVDETNPDMIHFEWTISKNTTLKSGNVRITICAKIANADGTPEREWHTIPNRDLFVNEGMDCSGDEIAELYPDVIDSILVEMDKLVMQCDGTDAALKYADLYSAITDINNDVTTNALIDATNAAVKVFTAHTGAKTVMLLGDVSEGAGITVNKDIDLVLNGKTLNLTTAASVLTFGAGTKCRINGEAPGSAIVKELTGATANANTILINGDELHICGGSYSLTGSNSGQNIAIKAGATCKLLEMVDATVEDTNTSTSARAIQTQAARTVLRGCTIHAVGGTSAADGLFGSGIKEVYNCKIRAKSGGTTGSYGIYDLTTTDKQIIKNSDIHTDAPDCHETVNSLGIYVRGQAFVENCTIYGTHSAITTRGELYIDGGVYTGFCHGGVYVSTNGMACINDATLRCGNYAGEFDYSNRGGEIYGSMYIGGSSNGNGLSAYLDGCTISGEGENSIVMRGTDGEHDNTIYISNSTVEGTVRIDNDTLKMYVGTGTNITTDKIDNPNRAKFTEELYRRNHADKVLNGRDYEALLAFLNSKIAT